MGGVCGVRLSLAVLASTLALASCGLRPGALSAPTPTPVTETATASPHASPVGTPRAPTRSISPPRQDRATPRSARQECRSAPDDRASVVVAFFLAEKSNDPLPTYAEALSMMRAADFPTVVTERTGAARWDQFAYAAGPLAALLPAARRLRAVGRNGSPDVSVYCAGIVSMGDRISVTTTRHADIEDVIRRMGGRERVDPDGYNTVSNDGRSRLWTVISDDARFVVERATSWLADPEVLGAQPLADCVHIPEAPAPPGCDFEP